MENTIDNTGASAVPEQVVTEQVVDNTQSTVVPQSTETAPVVDSVKTETAPVTPQSYKLKINGKDRDVTPEQMFEYSQKWLAGENKLKEAADREQAIYDMLKNDPWKLLETAGLDVEQLAHDRLLQKIQYDKMTPEQKELYALKQEKAQWDARTQQEKQMQEQQAYEGRISERQNAVAQDLLTELPKATDLPQNEETAVKIIEKMTAALAFGKEMSVTQAIESLRQDRQNVLSWMAQAKPEEVFKVLKPEQLNKLNEFQISDVKRQAQEARKGAPSANNPQVKQEPMTTEQWLEERMNKRGQ